MNSSSSSAYNNNNKKMKTTTTKTKTPFCKVCYDAGKNESTYTSHFVKDKQGPEGKVVCPYLLSLTCAFCKKSEGHTTRHCPILLKKNQQPQEHKEQHKEQHKDDDGWSTVSSSSSSKGKSTRQNVVVVANKPPASKYLITLATFIEQDEQRVINDEFQRVDKEVKRVKFDTDFPVLPVPAPPAAIANIAKEESSSYGTYNITPIAISWGDEDQW